MRGSSGRGSIFGVLQSRVASLVSWAFVPSSWAADGGNSGGYGRAARWRQPSSGARTLLGDEHGTSFVNSELRGGRVPGPEGIGISLSLVGVSGVEGGLDEYC
eukprot:5816082-Prymnesium_polylepis.1